MNTRPETGTEKWKQINDFPGYQVSSFGRVRSFKSKNMRVLKPDKVGHGYLLIRLFKNGVSYSKYVHRLVAEEFIDNPKRLPQVNHKNEIKIDNRVSNLEWCTCKYNLMFGTRIERVSVSLTGREISDKAKAKMSKPVKQLTLDGKLIKIWKSTREAGRNGFNQGEVSKCCRNESHKHHGYRWQYYTEENEK